MLTEERIPTLTVEELRELFFDSDAFGFWGNKEWEFNNRLQKFGLDGLCNALLELITQGQRGLTAVEMQRIWKMGGLGTLLSSELLTYRFSDRYWTYSPNVTLPALIELGTDVKASQPRSQQSDSFLYFALESHLAQVLRVLAEVGNQNVDYLLTDIFLWWVNKTTTKTADLTPTQLAEILRSGQRTTQSRKLTKAFLDQIAALLQGRVDGLDADIGVRARHDERKQGIQFIDRAFFYLTRDLTDDVGKKHSLELAVLLLPGEIWFGLHTWGSQSFAARVHSVFENLGLIEPDDRIQEVIGALGASQAWPSGGTFAIGKNLSADEVAAASDTNSLAARIANDLTDLCLRISPRISDLQQELLTPIAQVNRASPEDARQVMETLLPDPVLRKTCLNLLADAIVHAHRARPSGWSVSLFSNLVRFNAGKIRAHDIRAAQVHLVLATNALHEPARTAIENRTQTESDIYDSLPGTTDAEFPADSLPDLLPLLHDAHLEIVERATTAVRDRTPYYKSYSSGILAYLRDFLGRRDLPEPDYQRVVSDDQPPVTVAQVLRTHLTGTGLHFTDWQLATFYTALQTKGFVILSGISGTGKTKLAQAFAAALPQPAEAILPSSDDVLAITVQPYMPRYSRVIIPASAARLFDPPEAGTGRDVTVQFDGRSQPCHLVHAAYSGSHYLQLLFRGAARSWFKQNFKEGDTLYLEIEPDADGGLAGLRFSRTAPASSAQKPVPGAENHLFIPVRPDWRDSKSLLGYYNPLTSAYEWTPFLRFLLRAARSYEARDGLVWFVILDEMNLAHVEYYFADLLSVLESGRDDDGWTREPLRLGYPDDATGDLPPRELKLPPNLYVIGTVNVDETTHAFSPKVLDRAFTLELTDADFSAYPTGEISTGAGLSDQERNAILQDFTRKGKFARIDKQIIIAHVAAHPEIRALLQALNDLLRSHDLHFGYRVFDEIVMFLAAAEDNKLYDNLGATEAALDAAVLMKVLPKFHGSRSRLEAPLSAVLAWCVNPKSPDLKAMKATLQEVGSDKTVKEAVATFPFLYPRTADRVQRMLARLYTDGFAAFG